jgi:hypothetical protein
VKKGAHFKIHYELFDKPIWLQSTPEQKTVLIRLLGMANFREQEWEWKGEKFKCEPGQFVTSASSIVKKCGKGITRQNIRTALARFEKLEFLTIESTKSGMLVSIINWSTYQGCGNGSNHDSNQDLTNDQPRPNQDLTTSKKAIRKEKKPPTPFQEIVDIFKSTLPSLSVPILDDALRSQIRTRWTEHPEIEWWTNYFGIVSRSPWLLGRGSAWKATMPWLMGPKNISKVLNGQYLEVKPPNQARPKWEDAH